MYQLMLSDGRKVGAYSENASPGKTAEKIGKQIYKDGGFTGDREFDFIFVKNRAHAGTNDEKFYKFRARVKVLPKTPANLITTPDGRKFYRKYSIKVKNLLRD